MKPYARRSPLLRTRRRLLLCSLVVIVAINSQASTHRSASSAPAPAAKDSRPRFDDAHPEPTRIAEVALDPTLRSADEHYYSLEYDKAYHDYEKYEKEHPTDSFGENDLLKTVIFRELYRLNLLDTTTYAHDGFLSKTEPEKSDPKVRDQVEKLSKRAADLEETRLQNDPDDVDALYCRGVTRGLRATYAAMIDKSYIGALKNAMAARHDHERVLDLDPAYIDAKTVIGTDYYVVGSLPFALKVLAGMTGFSANKRKGLLYLQQVAAASGQTSVDARIALALFLRREADYPRALGVVQSLINDYPRNFLFALERANLLKDEGNGPAAIAAYRELLEAGKDRYPEAHMELAAFGLGESLRGQRDLPEAAKAYDSVSDMKNVLVAMRSRAMLAAAECYDLLGKRDMASRRYKQVMAADADGPYAAEAAKYLKHPYEQGS